MTPADFGPVSFDFTITGAVRGSAPRHWRDRGEKQCAWPIGDGPDLCSCCAPITTPRASYCDAHIAVAYERELDALNPAALLSPSAIAAAQEKADTTSLNRELRPLTPSERGRLSRCRSMRRAA